MTNSVFASGEKKHVLSTPYTAMNTEQIVPRVDDDSERKDDGDAGKEKEMLENQRTRAFVELALVAQPRGRRVS